MGSFWGPVTTANLERVGPWADIVAGTDGADTDINALVTAGHKRIILGTGSILTANLTLTASDGFFWAPLSPRGFNLGTFSLVISGASWHFEGFKLDGSAGVGLKLTGGGNITLHRVEVRDQTSHGVEGAGTGNDSEIMNCFITNNGGDGVKIAAAHANWRVGFSFIWNNTGWGINDLSNTVIEGSNRRDSNTAGSLSGTSTTIDGKSRSA